MVCPASLRSMWRGELSSATIAAEVVGMEELGRDGFDRNRIGDADKEARAELAGPEVLLKELKAGVRWWTANLDNNTSTTGLSSGGIRCTSTKQSRSVGVFAPTHPTRFPPR